MFFVGPGPVCLLLCCFGDETQVWLGDLRVVLVCVVVVLYDDLPFSLVLANCAVYRLFHRLCRYQDRATELVLSRLGVALFSFILVSYCVVCFWAPPLRPPRLLTRQLCGSGCICRPEFSIIRLKNNSIYLKPDESFVYIGGRVSIS